mgnify:CR=1 FL=1
MNIRPIHTDQDYRAALKSVSPLFDNEPQPGTPEGDYFDVMITLIEAYEARQFPLDLPNPIEAIKFRMEQQGLTARDLEPFIGPSGRVSEVLNRKRGLSLRMVKSLHDGLKIPYESLLAQAQ